MAYKDLGIFKYGLEVYLTFLKFLIFLINTQIKYKKLLSIEDAH
jgi:hypothetical protein